MAKQLVFAVTGPMAAGKNQVAQILSDMGFIALDADLVVHDAIEEAKEKIIASFSDDAKKMKINFVTVDGKINRRELGKIVFASKENLAKQEAIVHPAVDEIFNRTINSNPDKNIALNATVLYKTPTINRVDAIIYVTAPIITRLKRAKKRDGMKTSQILARFWAQRNLFSKYKISNTDIYKVNNYRSLDVLRNKIEKIVKNYGL